MLTVSETATLANCEQIIERGLATFIEVGNALRTIRDSRLYKATHGTFENYVKERWGWSRSRAYQLIDAASDDRHLSTMVDKTKSDSPVIENERQAREVAKAPPEKQAEVVTRAHEIATGQDRKPVSKDFAQAREEVVPSYSDDEYEDYDPDPEMKAEPVAAPDNYDMAVIRAWERCSCRIGTLYAIEERLHPHERALIAERLAASVEA